MPPSRPTDDRVFAGVGATTRPGPRRVGGLAGDVIVGVLGGIFALVGLALLIFVAPDPRHDGAFRDHVGILVVGVLFTLVGCGLLALVVHARGTRRGEAALRARYPDEPWMWKPDWAAGELRGSARANAVLAWSVALVWNAISWPMLPRLLEEMRGGNTAAALGVLFPAVGIGLLAWALLAAVRARRFGVAVLTLDTRPGRIGGRFSARVETGRPLPRDAGATLRLVCVRRATTGAGKSRRSHDTVLWEDRIELAAGQLGRGVRGTLLPATFEIPEGCPPSDDTHPDDRVLWRLEARAELPGADLVTHFEVPVFRTT